MLKPGTVNATEVGIEKTHPLRLKVSMLTRLKVDMLTRLKVGMLLKTNIYGADVVNTASQSF